MANQGNFVFVHDGHSLDELIAGWRRKKAVAIDTEFVRVSTYYPILGLVQVADGTECYLIDPQELDIAILGELFEDPSVVKVLHACSEDLEVFQHHLGVLPAPLFDTQVAAALLGQGYSMSYQNLVQAVLGITIDKGETRSDWTRRPLTDSQCRYAALDVIHLLEVFTRQNEKLWQMGRIGWLEEECRLLLKAPVIGMDENDFYLRARGGWKLNRSELNVLKVLCAWRETRARELDMPRNRIANEKALFDIARMKPANKAELQSVAGLTYRQIRKYGSELLLLAHEARLVPDKLCPALMERPLPRQSGRLMKRLKAVVASRAGELGLPIEIVARKRHLEALLRSRNETGAYELPDSLAGWRKEIVGRPLLEALEGQT